MTRPKRLPKVLSLDEQRALLARFNTRYLSSLRNLVLVQLMLRCGLRCGEAIALKPEHIDLQTCRLIVREGKGKKDRTLWFDDDLRDLIEHWLLRRPSSEWLLCTRHGTQMSSRYAREMIKRKAIAARIPEASRVTPHSLRHSFATDLLRRERNILLVQRALGHASVVTTQVYTHLADAELEDALRRRSPR